MLAAGIAAALAPLPASAQAQNQRRGNGPPAVAGRATMLRAGPEQGYPQVRRIEQGQQVQLYGCLSDRSWCDVRLGQDRGWVSGPDLQAEFRGRRDSVANLYGQFQLGDRDFRIGDYWDDNYRQQPFYADRTRWEQQYGENYRTSWGPRQNGTRWANRTTAGVMLRQAWVRAGPDLTYPRVGLARARSRVIVHGCLRDWSWCDISSRRGNRASFRGWVVSQHIASLYQGRQQPLNNFAPRIGIGVLGFNINRYWGENYRTQPFYGQRDRWERQYRQNYRPTWGTSAERDGPDQDERNRDRRDRDERYRDGRPRPDAG
ncbi:MAG: hypothetical protein B7Y35_03025 [Sphingomonadales bacterium 28-64-96]|nr:MAG: hypothetical protein B7Y35_03025 [Sphingomonadales bacterium 28-64-96]